MSSGRGGPGNLLIVPTRLCMRCYNTDRAVQELLGYMHEANTYFTDYESFYLVTVPGAMSLEHIDGGNCETMVTVRRGSNIWLVQDPENPDHKELVLLLEGSQM